MNDDKKRIWIFVGAGCSVMLLGMCCLMATGLYYCKSAWDDVGETAEAFLADVREGRIDDAYGRMADEYRADKDLQDFRRDLEQTPGMLDHTEALLQQRFFETGRVRVGGVLSTPRGVIPFEMILVESGGRLWVAGVQVGEVDAPGAAMGTVPEPEPGTNAATDTDAAAGSE